MFVSVRCVNVIGSQMVKSSLFWASFFRRKVGYRLLFSMQVGHRGRLSYRKVVFLPHMIQGYSGALCSLGQAGSSMIVWACGLSIGLPMVSVWVRRC